ncbi:MAG: Rpn family recombination-promoting nuclease/putative transposase [Selenomonadaceae bacterium]|nr:Rpn family recombination-promoting nuclease/putative transposase [Selenomonadaceae bacterium]
MSEDLWKKHCARIQEYCFMDDIFFSVCFDGNKKCVQYILRIILDKEDLIVEEVHSQQTIEIVYGRSVRLDVFAKDSSGKLYDIEIQRTDKGAIPQRARYNSSMLDYHSLNKGTSYTELPETYVIFITENDVLKDGEQIYFIDRTIRKSGKLFNDGSHIIYVNGSIRAGSPLGDLMHDFFCRTPSQMKHETLADCSEFFKNPDRGGYIMSSATEELIAEGRHEGEAIGFAKGEAVGLVKGEAIGLTKGEAIGLTKGEAIGTRKTLLENVRHLMNNFRLTAEAAMNALGISPETQKELAPLI